MQDFVSRQTAIALREAGFPQPEPESGQTFFLTHHDGPYIYMRKGCGDTLDLRSPRGFWAWKKPESSDLFFAPSAIDILKELGERYVLWYDNSPRVLKWCCAKMANTIDETTHPFMHQNPAEAAAKAWLKNKNK